MGIVLRNAVDLVDNHHIHGIFHFRSICYSVVVTHKPHSAGDCGGISLPYPSKFNSFFISLLFLFSILLHRHVSSAWIQLLPVISLLSCIRVPSVIPLLTISVLVCYVSFACIQLYRSYRCCPVIGPISYLIPVLFPVSKACPCCLFLCLLVLPDPSKSSSSTVAPECGVPLMTQASKWKPAAPCVCPFPKIKKRDFGDDAAGSGRRAAQRNTKQQDPLFEN